MGACSSYWGEAEHSTGDRALLWALSPLWGEALMKPLVGPMLHSLSTGMVFCLLGRQVSVGPVCPQRLTLFPRAFRAVPQGGVRAQGHFVLLLPPQSPRLLVPMPSPIPTTPTMTKSTFSSVRQPWKLGSGSGGTSTPGWPGSARSVAKASTVWPVVPAAGLLPALDQGASQAEQHEGVTAHLPQGRRLRAGGVSLWE